MPSSREQEWPLRVVAAPLEVTAGSDLARIWMILDLWCELHPNKGWVAKHRAHFGASLFNLITIWSKENVHLPQIAHDVFNWLLVSPLDLLNSCSASSLAVLFTAPFAK